MRSSQKTKTNDTKYTARKRAHNALTHGIYARDIVLPWESKVKFEQLFEELCRDYSPVGTLEHDAVLDIARYQWIKRRLIKFDQISREEDPLYRELREQRLTSFSEVRKYVRTKKLSAEDLAVREALLSMTSAGVASARALGSSSTPGRASDVAAKLVDAAERLDDVLLFRHEHALRGLFSLERLEKLIEIYATLDLRTEKAVMRLTFHQETRRLRMKQIPPRNDKLMDYNHS